MLLGLIIEKLTNDSVGDQITKRLIKPYHLTNTSYPATEAMPEPWARGYDLNAHNEWEDVSGTIPVSLMGAAGEMVSNIGDMKRWLKLYVTGKTNGISTQRARLNCLPIGADNVYFGLGIACSSGWFGYTGGLSGYNTANYYFPAGEITVFAWVAQQRDKPSPGVANKIFSDIARIMTPSHPPFVSPAHQPKPVAIEARVGIVLAFPQPAYMNPCYSSSSSAGRRRPDPTARATAAGGTGVERAHSMARTCCCFDSVRRWAESTSPKRPAAIKLHCSRLQGRLESETLSRHFVPHPVEIGDHARARGIPSETLPRDRA